MRAITDEDAKELVSKCLIGLCSASARLNVSGSLFDRQSADMVLEAHDKKAPAHKFSQATLKIQAKCTSKPNYSDATRSHLSIRLPVKNYEDLRAKQQTRHILVVAVLGSSVDTCLVYKRGITVRARLFYLELKGASAPKNKSKEPVLVPVANSFDHSVALTLLREVLDEVWKP